MRPLRNPWFIRLAAWLVAGYLRFALGTLRWTWDGRERVETVWAQPGGAVLCLWHYNIPLSAACWPPGPRQEVRVLISQSADGEFIAQTMKRLGFGSIRGSSAKAKGRDKDKGGAAAFRELLRWVKGGGAAAITPDGPRGPAQVMGEGPVLLAGMSGAPVILCALACKPGFRLGTWDRTFFPLPFGRGVVAWDGPVRIDKRSDAEGLEAARAELERRLNAVTARAEALLA